MNLHLKNLLQMLRKQRPKSYQQSQQKEVNRKWTLPALEKGQAIALEKGQALEPEADGGQEPVLEDVEVDIRNDTVHTHRLRNILCVQIVS